MSLDPRFARMFGADAVTPAMRDAAAEAASGPGTYRESARGDLAAAGIPMRGEGDWAGRYDADGYRIDADD